MLRDLFLKLNSVILLIVESCLQKFGTVGSSADKLVKTFLILRKDCFPWKSFIKR
jgi:hypothetical protein